MIDFDACLINFPVMGFGYKSGMYRRDYTDVLLGFSLIIGDKM